MIPLWLVPLIAYTCIGIIGWRMIAGHLAWKLLASYKRDYPILSKGVTEPTGPEWLGAAILAFPVVALWPMLLFALRMPIRKIGAERNAERRQMAARIKELEKEVGL